MQYRLIWDGKQIADGERDEPFLPGDLVATGIREYRVLAANTDLNGVQVLNVEPADA